VKAFHCNPSTSKVALQHFEKTSGYRLPQDYAEFLERANGGEGYLNPNQYAILWRVEDLARLNEAYLTRKYVPGLLFFGSNGGGEAFAFDQRSNSSPVVRVPFVGMDLGLAEVLAQSFTELIREALLDWPSGTGEGSPGLEVFEIQPIILGGSPTDASNKVALTRDKHIEAVRYWNKLIGDLHRR